MSGNIDDLLHSTILSSRFVTFTGLFVVLGTCVYLKNYVVLYCLFTFPGTYEFISMAKLTSDTYVGTLSIMAIYLYNIALATSITLIVAQDLHNSLPNIKSEEYFKKDFYNYTLVYLLFQLPLLLLNVTFERLPNNVVSSPTFKVLSLVALGGVWCPGLTFFAALIAARTGINFLSFLFIVTGLQDNWQLMFGKLFGRYRPFRYLSPKKSVEGYIGGTIMTIITIWYMKTYFKYDWIKLSLIVVVLGILGDLSMSYVKRLLSLKDTGDVLPGVGGLLDRMDSQLLILPATYWLNVEP